LNIYKSELNIKNSYISVQKKPLNSSIMFAKIQEKPLLLVAGFK